MSQSYYQELWKNNQKLLEKNLEFERKVKKKEPFPDRNVAKWLIGHLFLNYVTITNQLDKCYDQMIHPQKREVIGRLLDMSLGRLLELKAEIVRIELDNYCFFDNILIELKLTHSDLEIHVPRYYWHDKEKIKAHRRKLMNQVFEEVERENFRINYLKNIPEDAREEAWEKFLIIEEQQRLEKEKLEEQQRKMGVKAREINSFEKIIQDIIGTEPCQKDSNVTKAILLIQRHERARQGRVEAIKAAAFNKIKERGKPSVKKPAETIVDKSAKIIQKFWKKYKQRMQEKKKHEKINELLGITEPSYKDTSGLQRLQNIEKLRRKFREKNESEKYIIRDKMITIYADTMERDITEEIRNWFHWFFKESNFLPDFPPERLIIPKGDVLGVPKPLGSSFTIKLREKTDEFIPKSALGVALSGITAIGGSALVAAGHWITPYEYVICKRELDKMKKEGKITSKNKLSKEEKLARKKLQEEQEKKKNLSEATLSFQLKPSNFVAPLKKANRDFKMTWSDADETKNYEQKYIYDFVKDEICYELSMEIRKVVDKMMRLELEVLKDALEKDKNPKKKRKKKNSKLKKEKKNNEKKDPTGDRTLDELFMELYRNGIIRDYQEARMEDYMGERSYCAFEFRDNNLDWPPSIGDVRELILQLCILPLGSSRIHQLAPLRKSVCLMGSKNSGKEFLARIICTETASVMFDLSPTNVVEKYSGKNGLRMLQHLIEKMSRALQPSIIFVDEAEKTFYSKVPKKEKELEPKRMARIIKKIVKGIKPSDQVLLLGVSSQPWLAKKKMFLKTYQNLIFIPQMDYGSYFRVWQTLLTPYHSISRNFDFSSLAKASSGYSIKAIIDAVKGVLTAQRISRSLFQPISPPEFLEELLKSKQIDEKLADKCLKFYEKTELPKKRAKHLEQIKQEIEKTKKKSKEPKPN